jgi:hypothetical protein
MLWWSIIVYSLSLTFIKYSILVQYRKVFGSSWGMRIAIWIVGAFIFCLCTEAILVNIFTCSPVRAFWDLTIQPMSKCINTQRSVNDCLLAHLC